MTKYKLNCQHCGNKILNPRSQYQQYCDECVKLNKENGGEINMVEKAKAAAKVKATVKKPVKADNKAESKTLAVKVLAHMKDVLKIEDMKVLFAVNRSVWLLLKEQK